MLSRHPPLRLFATGHENQFCRLCHVQLSLKTRKYRAIHRHFQTRDHLRKEQRNRFAHPGKTVYSRFGRPLFGVQLEMAKNDFMTIADMPKLAPKKHLIRHVDVPLLSFSSFNEEILQSLVVLLNRWLSHGGSLQAVIELWTHFGVVTQHSHLCTSLLLGTSTPPFYLHRLSFYTLLEYAFTSLSDIGRYSLEVVDQGTTSFVYFSFWNADAFNLLCVGSFDRQAKAPLRAMTFVSHMLTGHNSDIHLCCLTGFPRLMIRCLDSVQGGSMSSSYVHYFTPEDLADVIRLPTVLIFWES